MKQRKLVIGKESISSERVAHRVHRDIAVLSARLARLKKQADQDPQTLKACQEMLRSRHAVLKWLRETPRDSASASMD